MHSLGRPSRSDFVQIEFGGADNYIEVQTQDKIIFDRFFSGYRDILDVLERSKEIEVHIKDVSGDLEAIKECLRLMEECIEIIDSIFGKGTIKKYFHRFYEDDVDFVPWDECFLDFLEQITPVMEKLFHKKIHKQEKDRAKRLKKKDCSVEYKPAICLEGSR